MFNDPTIVIIDGLPPNFTKPDVIKLVMQTGSVDMRVLILRNSLLKPCTKTTHILILNSCIVEKVMTYFNGFMVGTYQLTTSSRPFLRRTSRSIYQPDATADQRRYYSLSHQILNETIMYHPNFRNIDLRCQHKLSVHVLAACVDEMAKIEAKERRTLSNHELTKAYRIQHPLNNEAERLVEKARPLCNLVKKEDFFSKPSVTSFRLQVPHINDAIGRKMTSVKHCLRLYVEEKMKKPTPDENKEQCDITTAHEMVYQQVEKLQSELLFHLKEILRQEMLPEGHYLSTNYLKIYGLPALPKPVNLKRFLKTYCPTEVYHHREMYNLAVVFITHEPNLKKLMDVKGKIIDGCLLCISPASAELIEDVQKQGDEDNQPQQQKVMEPMECDEVIVITDEEQCMEDAPRTEVKLQTKEGEEKRKLPRGTNTGGMSNAEECGNSNMEQGVSKCKVDIKTETVRVGDTDLKAESIEKIENAITTADQTELPKNEIMDGQDMKECLDLTADEEADLSDEVGSAETDEDYKIIDEVFENFNFDAVCGSDE